MLIREPLYLWSPKALYIVFLKNFLPTSISNRKCSTISCLSETARLLKELQKKNTCEGNFYLKWTSKWEPIMPIIWAGRHVDHIPFIRLTHSLVFISAHLQVSLQRPLVFPSSIAHLLDRGRSKTDHHILWQTIHVRYISFHPLPSLVLLLGYNDHCTSLTYHERLTKLKWDPCIAELFKSVVSRSLSISFTQDRMKIQIKSETAV